MKKVLLSLLLILGLIGSSVMVAYADEVVTVVSGIKNVSASTTSTAKYNSHWQYWSQGASGYAGMRKAGCRVVAYSKLLAEVGYADFANPDVFFEWGVKKGYFNSLNNPHEEVGAGVPPTKYVQEKGGTLKLEGQVTLTGNNKKDGFESIKMK